jgi:hypothetical protein
MDLGLHHKFAGPELTGDFLGLIRSRGPFAGRGGDAEFFEEFFRLIFVNIHRVVGAMD